MRTERRDWRQIALLILATAILGAGIWYAHQRERRALQAEIDQLEQGLGLSEDQPVSLTALAEEVDLLRVEARREVGQVPGSARAGEVYRCLSDAFGTTEVVERDITTLASREYARYGVVPVRVGFTSGFPEAFGVLKRMESSYRLMRVDRLEFDLAGEGTREVVVSMELSAFYSSADQEGGER